MSTNIPPRLCDAPTAPCDSAGHRKGSSQNTAVATDQQQELGGCAVFDLDCLVLPPKRPRPRASECASPC